MVKAATQKTSKLKDSRMKKDLVKLVYDSPQTDLVYVQVERFICTSITGNVTVEEMEEDGEYGWEI